MGALQGGRRRAVRRAHRARVGGCRSVAREDRREARAARGGTRRRRRARHRQGPQRCSPAIQRQWDEIGRIFPRDAERALDDDLRKIEQALRTREETDWKRNNPETKARANDMTRQLTEAIEKLEDELAAAEKSGDKAAIAKATEALEARRAWLNALGG